VTQIPSRDELYGEVDKLFREKHPSAPARLSRTSATHAEWRRDWLEMRDVLLNAVVDRIYWQRHPQAPLQIDPNDPEHDAYRQYWLDIRGAIMGNAPEPEDRDGDGLADVDVSGVRARYDYVIETHAVLYGRDDLAVPVREFSERALGYAAAAAAGGDSMGELDGIWEYGEEIRAEGQGETLWVTAKVWWEGPTLSGDLEIFAYATY
jgi:hypothetical protein